MITRSNFATRISSGKHLSKMNLIHAKSYTAEVHSKAFLKQLETNRPISPPPPPSTEVIILRNSDHPLPFSDITDYYWCLGILDLQFVPYFFSNRGKSAFMLLLEEVDINKSTFTMMTR